MPRRCKKCPIEISIISYKLIFVFIFPIVGVLQAKLRQKYILNEQEYFRAFSYYLSYIFSFFFIIIMRILYRNNKKKEEKEEKEEDNKKEEAINNSKDESSEIESEITLSEKKSKKNNSTSIIKNIMDNKNFKKFLWLL